MGKLHNTLKTKIKKDFQYVEKAWRWSVKGKTERENHKKHTLKKMLVTVCRKDMRPYEIDRMAKRR